VLYRRGRSLKNLNASRLTLKDFNQFSAQTLGGVTADFAKHTKVLRSIKSDLDYIFKHTRCETCKRLSRVLGRGGAEMCVMAPKCRSTVITK
jgi:hypothetical protein